MTTEGKRKAKAVGTVTVTGSMILAALFWGGSTDANVKNLHGEVQELKSVYRVISKLNTRLSRMEGAMGIKPDPSLDLEESKGE